MHPLRLFLRLHRPVGGRRIRLGLVASSLLALVTVASAAGPNSVGAQVVIVPTATPAAATLPPLLPIDPFPVLRLPPAITLSLSIGPPGTVITVTGARFPSLSPVQLQWTRGVPFMTGPIGTDQDGTFATQFLVMFGDDVFGPRELRAVSEFGLTARIVVTAQAPFMVVPHTATPPVVDVIRSLWGTRPFVFRH